MIDPPHPCLTEHDPPCFFCGGGPVTHFISHPAYPDRMACASCYPEIQELDALLDAFVGEV